MIRGARVMYLRNPDHSVDVYEAEVVAGRQIVGAWILYRAALPNADHVQQWIDLMEDEIRVRTSDATAHMSINRIAHVARIWADRRMTGRPVLPEVEW